MALNGERLKKTWPTTTEHLDLNIGAGRQYWEKREKLGSTSTGANFKISVATVFFITYFNEINNVNYSIELGFSWTLLFELN